jgi:hypothetical protein
MIEYEVYAIVNRETIIENAEKPEVALDNAKRKAFPETMIPQENIEITEGEKK